MGLSFLSPLLFAGVGLLVVPFLIHQIRKPEREPLRFSSLLFIPNVPKDVVERRRIQHFWLMLLRMLLFLLLVLAFTRPYWKALAALEEDQAPGRHLILLDRSWSMGAAGVFEKAKEEALAIISGLGEGDRVGVVAFAQSHEELAPLFSSVEGAGGAGAAGSHEGARRAIEGATLTMERTAYVPALQFSQNRLLAGLNEDEDEDGQDRLFLHVISDFQRIGMPQRHRGWKLAPSIALHPVGVGPSDAGNYAITDIGVKRTQSGDLRILGKVKNWSTTDVEDLVVTLFVNGEEIGQNRLALQGGNATQTSFRLEGHGVGPIEGRLELSADGGRAEGRGPDGLAADNVRYFTWNVPRKKRVLILADEGTVGRPKQQWPPVLFFSRALPQDGDLPWTTEFASQDALGEVIANPAMRPAVVIGADLAGFAAETGEKLLDFAAEGGQVLLVLNESMDIQTLNLSFFSKLGIETTGPKYARTRETRFSLMSWVDLDHEIFAPFRGARFNDFSVLRFHNYLVLEVGDSRDSVRVGAGLEDGSQDTVRVVARFEDDSPAVLEAPYGEGRIIVWAFSVSLDSTNLPKSTRFVPLLHETLGYLCDLEEGALAWLVGQRVSTESLVMDEAGISVVQAPGEAESSELGVADPQQSGRLYLRQAGFFRTKAKDDAEWRQVDAVNVDAKEGDPTPVSLAEFELKLASAPVLPGENDESGIAERVSEESLSTKEEFGHRFLIALFALILLESWYMTSIKR